MRSQRLLTLLSALPFWEQDALRQLLRNDSLDEGDRRRAFNLLKQECGIRSAGGQLTVLPLTEADLARLTPPPGSFLLAGLEAGCGCNKLAAGTRLPIDPHVGVQIYIGRNGSGKSSFVRLLRTVGSARVRGDILPDVFASSSVRQRAFANFDVVMGGQAQTLHWTEQGGPDPRLAAVAVYDRACSAVYLEQGNVADYLPRGLDVFATLVELRKWLKGQAEQEAAILSTKMPCLPWEYSSTKIGGVIDGLGSAAEKQTQLQRLANWAPADEARLNELGKQRDLGAQRRQRLAEQLGQLAQAKLSITLIDNAARAIAGLPGRVPATLPEDVNRTKAQIAAKQAEIESAEAQAVADQAVNGGLASHLAGVNSAEWLAMIRAARVYSESHAYPGVEFPAVTAAARCPLCQQELQEEAAHRLRQFAEVLRRIMDSAFAEHERVRPLRRELEDLEGQLAGYFHRLDEALIEVRQLAGDLPRQLAKPGLAGAANALHVVLNGLALKARRGQPVDVEVAEFQHAVAQTCRQLAFAKQQETERTETLEQDSREAPELFDESELSELKARKWLKMNLPQMLERVNQAETVAQLEQVAKELSISPITSLSKRVAAELVTDRLVDELRRQLHAVGLGYLQAQVVSSGRAGVTTIRLAPPAAGFKKTDLSLVLSEGEQALMGLAAFFAELEVAGHAGPIVLDDPITGLDWENRQVMANRLVVAGMNRQVLVLTHDGEFAAMLEDAAHKHTVRCKRRAIVRNDTRVGVVT